MNPDLLLAHFNRISDSPDALPRLRAFIIDLAVRGKLVEQDPNDESGFELLKRIKAEKVRLVESGAIKAGKPLTDVEDDDLFQLPKGWAWTKWDAIALKIGDIDHKMPDTVTHGVPFISPRDFLPGNRIDFDGAKRVSFEDFARLSAKMRPAIGDLIYPRYGTIGESRLVTEQRDFLVSYSCAVIKVLVGFVDAQYQFLYSISTFCRAQARAAENKTTQANVGIKSIQEFVVPLPPLAEQHRIVAKVDELMAVCDRLEAARTVRENQRDRLAAASLHHFNNGATPEAVREHAYFYIKHLPNLTTRTDHIKQLRRTILSLAIRGQLVPQDHNDEPASELLNRIEAEKTRLLKERKTKPLAPLAPIDYSQVPFRLPATWKWVRFGELVTDADAGWSPKCEAFPREGENWGVLKVSAVSWDRFLPDENKQLLSGAAPPASAQVRAGDFLISRANTSQLVAKCVVVSQAPKNLILSDKIVRLQISESCSKHFLCMVNNYAEHARAYYAEEASGTSFSMKNVSRAVIYRLLVPLPPLAEQRRIIARVDELMVLCAELEAQLVTAQDKISRLLEAVLYHALSTPSPQKADSVPSRVQSH